MHTRTVYMKDEKENKKYTEGENRRKKNYIEIM